MPGFLFADRTDVTHRAPAPEKQIKSGMREEIVQRFGRDATSWLKVADVVSYGPG
jgi:hypothetical protein